MKKTLELLKASFKSDVEPELNLITKKEKSVVDSFKIKAKRFTAYNKWQSEDLGMLVYNYDANDATKNTIEISFALIEEFKSDVNIYDEKFHIVDLFQFSYSNKFLSQFNRVIKMSESNKNILSFTHKESFNKIFSLDQKKKDLLHQVIENSLEDLEENIFYNAAFHEFLMQSLDCLLPTRKPYEFQFLSDEHSFNAVISSKEILLKNIHNPMTIKELSRKVAINECYLKKGFKEVFGTTIFDFYHQQRMEHAKYLLDENKSTVSEVADKLGYTSISHFSAAFRKHTGKSPIFLGK